MESTRSLMEQSEGLMAVVVLKFLGFWQMLREKKYLLLQKQTGSVLKKDYFTSWVKNCIISPVPFQSGLFDLSKRAKSL